MVPRHDHDLRIRQLGAETQELPERAQDRGGRGARDMGHVPGDEHDLGAQRDYLVDGAPEGTGHVRLTLVDASGREALVLAVPEMKIREMDEAHALSPNLA